MRRQYPFQIFEPKWQEHWHNGETFRAWNPGESVPPTIRFMSVTRT